MPELVVYDKRNKRVHVNSVIKYRGMRAVVVELINSRTVKYRIGGMINIASTLHIEVVR